MSISQEIKRQRSKSWNEFLSRPALNRSDSLNSPTYLQAILWGLALIIGLGLMIYTYPKYQVGAHFDDAIYIILSKSLLYADKYGLINYPGEPVTWRYPFGFPLLLSPFVRFFSDNLFIYKLISVIATLINTSILFWGWRWLNRKLSYWWALAITVLHILSPLTIDLTGRVMSEPVFLTFYLLSMVLAERLIIKSLRREMGRARLTLWSIWMGICLMMVVFTRTIGLVLFISIITYLFIKLRSAFIKPFLLTMVWAALFLSIIVVATPVEWSDMLPTKYLTDDQAALLLRLTGVRLEKQQPVTTSPQPAVTVESSEGQSLKTLLFNYFGWGMYIHFSRDIRAAVFPFAGNDLEAAYSSRIGLPFLPFVIGIGFSLIVFLGYLRWFTRYEINSFNITSVIYFFALFAWVWDDPRFLYPIQPQLLTALLLGIEGLIFLGIRLIRGGGESQINNPRILELPSRILAAFVLITVLLSVYKSVIISDSRLHIGELSSRTAWLCANTPKDAVILSEYPVLDYVYCERKTVEYPHKNASEEQFSQLIHSKNVGYILVAPRIYWMKPSYSPAFSIFMSSWLPLLDELKQKKAIDLIYTSSDQFTRVYRVLP